jgi:hypothetical protein
LQRLQRAPRRLDRRKATITPDVFAMPDGAREQGRRGGDPGASRLVVLASLLTIGLPFAA